MEETSLFPEPDLWAEVDGERAGDAGPGASLPVWRPLLGNASTQQQFLVISVWVQGDTEVLLSGANFNDTTQRYQLYHYISYQSLTFLSYSWMFIPFTNIFPIFPPSAPGNHFFTLCFNESDF